LTALSSGQGLAEASGGRVSEEELLRAATYGLLGRLLVRTPDAELLRRLAAVAGEPGDEGLAGAWAALAAAARDAVESELDDEYHQLFIGVGRGELVPFASYYLSGFLMERPLGELRAELRALGIARRPEVHEPEDHISALCEVMALLISEPGYGPEAQRGFHARHFGPWAERFFNDLERASGARFYCPVGWLGRELMQLERQYHGEWQ